MCIFTSSYLWHCWFISRKSFHEFLAIVWVQEDVLLLKGHAHVSQDLYHLSAFFVCASHRLHARDVNDDLSALPVQFVLTLSLQGAANSIIILPGNSCALIHTSIARRSIGEASGFAFIFLKFCMVVFTLSCTPLIVPLRLIMAPLLVTFVSISLLSINLASKLSVMVSVEFGTSNEAMAICIGARERFRRSG